MTRRSRADFVTAGERVSLRTRAVMRMIDAIAVAAQSRPDRCGEIGFDDRDTHLLAKLAEPMRHTAATGVKDVHGYISNCVTPT